MNRSSFLYRAVVSWLRKFTEAYRFPGLCGDFEEMYASQRKKSRFHADFWLIGQALRLGPHYYREHTFWRMVMLKNYLKTTLRNILKYKVYSLINIIGLTVGMSCCIFILIWVRDELSFDRFHQHADTLYRVIETEALSDGRVLTYSVLPAALAGILKSEYPEVLEVARYKTLGTRVIQFGDTRFYETGFAFADPELLNLFTFPFTKGNSGSALSEPGSVVITEEMGKRYFGNEDPIGKTLRVDDRLDFKVTGVLRNIPTNSHMRFNFVVPFETIANYDRDIEGWDSWAYNTYLQLEKGIDYIEFSEKIERVIQNHDEDAIALISLQPVNRIHLFSSTIHGMGGDGNIQYVYVFSVIAMLILLIACVNFMNLSTARSSTRAKEVGMRKVVGATRKELIRQFFSESIILAGFSMITSMVLVYLLLPAFNKLSGKALALPIFNDPQLVIGILLTGLVAGLVSGAYPAFFLSAFKPAAILKGSSRSGKNGVLFRRVLVIIQFLFTVSLLIGTLVVFDQLQYLQKRNLGFDSEHVLFMGLRGDLNKRYPVLKDELLKNPRIQNVTAASDLPTNNRASILISDWEGKKSEGKLVIELLWFEENYPETFGLEMVAGEFFSTEKRAKNEDGLVLNQSAVEAMGLDAPIGKRIEESHVIGVIKDFHFYSLHQTIAPLIISSDLEAFRYVFMKIEGQHLASTIQFIEETWKRFTPVFPFEYKFLDDSIDAMYRADRRIGQLINVFTVLTLFVACLGLFGLASFMAERRTKEIGVRKILGASIPSIIFMLSKAFLKWVCMANLIAWPIAYFMMNRWLQGFAYRTSIKPGIIMATGLFSLLIALLTVSYQAVKAALANPVNSLRNE